MTTPNRIPLFPLDVVLFPTMQLPLHVFEPRYKVMIRRCLEEPINFGIVLATKDSVASVGCTARIVRKVKDYPDGRMDILTEGVSVFRLTRILDENVYHEGLVSIWRTRRRRPIRSKKNSSVNPSKAATCSCLEPVGRTHQNRTHRI